MSIYLGETPLANNAVSRNIGEIIQSTIPLSDAGLHLLDGALISSAGSYTKFVNYISGLITNYPDLFTTEANWQSSVTTYGVCGKFVYDSVNNTVRLPKITGFTEGTIDPTLLGNLTEAGLPNITGRVDDNTFANYPSASGAFSIATGWTWAVPSGSTANGGYFAFDASRSNSIYGNSSTVQPQSIKVLYYIVIASSIKTNIEVDIDEIATDLNGKADVDLSNVNASGTSLASAWSMPSSRYIDLTLGASGATYIAPANGWAVCRIKASSANLCFCEILNKSNLQSVISNCYTATHIVESFVPLKKGSVYAVNYANGTPEIFRFIYAEGEN